MTDHQPIPLALSPDGAEGRPGSNPSACPCAGSPTKVMVRYRNGHVQPSTWSEERVAALQRLYAEGLTCSQIAAEIGGTRLAVIGKVHRLGLPLRGRNSSETPHKIRKPRVRVRKLILPAPLPMPAPIVVEAEFPEPKGGLIPFAETKRGRCRFIFGDGPEWLCCPKRAVRGSSWCDEHEVVVFTPAHRSERMLRRVT